MFLKLWEGTQFLRPSESPKPLELNVEEFYLTEELISPVEWTKSVIKFENWRVINVSIRVNAPYVFTYLTLFIARAPVSNSRYDFCYIWVLSCERLLLTGGARFKQIHRAPRFP